MSDNLRSADRTEAARLRGLLSFSPGKRLGLTPSQLFLLSVVLFVNIALLSCFALIVFDKIDISKLF